jgi:EAL domain-containing protein (putative c-di-GMP-specific phosphodiesterase class I)
MAGIADTAQTAENFPTKGTHRRSNDGNTVRGGAVEAREIWNALERDEVEVHLQSEVWLEDGRHFGFEALPRMRHSSGLIGPERFVPSAEHTAVGLPLARRLVERALLELEARDGMRPDAVVSIAPSGLSEPAVYETVTGALAATGSEPSRLCLEVPSHLPFDDLEGAREAWSALRRLGVRFALDRCGAGAGNGDDVQALPLGPMALFPFDYVRVDRSLIRATSRSARARRLVATIARTARQLEAIPVADGIETNTEALAAYGLGCRVAQGPRFGDPLPPRANGRHLRAVPAPVPRPAYS